MADDWNCSELQHMVIGAHLNRIKMGSYPDRWVCDECYDHIFSDGK